MHNFIVHFLICLVQYEYYTNSIRDLYSVCNFDWNVTDLNYRVLFWLHCSEANAKGRKYLLYHRHTQWPSIPCSKVDRK